MVYAMLLVSIIIATIVASSIIAGLFIELTLIHKRPLPLILGLVSGIITALLGLLNYLKSHVLMYLVLPIIVTAVVACMSCRADDWRVLLTKQGQETKGNWMRDIVSILIGVVGAVIGAWSNIGKPVLLALGRDVSGSTPAELYEVWFAGGIFGFFVASFGSLLLWSMRVSWTRR